ncbi:MAG TPA: hypothetical protein VJQ47_08035 [Steroidobacteraceae bacterium]|nr:hypothetical protein [Steroidobacteraceae bacterium]
MIKHEAAYTWAPDVIEYLSIRPHRRCSQVVALEAGFTVSEVIVEDVIAQPDIRSAAQPWKETVVGELVREREGP